MLIISCVTIFSTWHSNDAINVYIYIIKNQIDSIILGVRVNSWDARTQLEFWDSEKRLEIEADNLSAVTDLKT